MAVFRIGDRSVSDGDRPFIVAEIGVNYENDLEMADRMIQVAAQSGADAVKFQTYKADKLAAARSPAYWSEGRTQRQYFEMYDHFGEREYKHLAETAARERVQFLSTPFDKEAADFLDPLLPAFKIASADITNLDLLRHVARKGKPVMLSTGASTLAEIARAVETLEEHGSSDIALLHCILHYPADFTEVNLLSIPYLKQCFPNCVTGYSDHTNPDESMALLTAAGLMGAAIIEKHFTLDKTKPGNDHYHAMDPSDLSRIVANLDLVWGALGSRSRPIIGTEAAARSLARRSVVAAVDLPKGTRLSPEHLTCKRPCTGIPAEYFDLVVGRTVAEDIAADTILEWRLLR